jgi:hypothetical protein
MNNFVKTQLDKFEKPDKSFMLGKECLVCLESVDLELNEIVKLPCNCSNSVYHIICIEKFLKSGDNNNFCPHCKTKYVITLQKPIENYIVIDRANDTYRLIKIKEIILVHIVLNSIMNIINLLIIRNATNIDEAIQVLALFYLCKIFLNFCIFLFSKNNTEKIEDLLIFSYTYQIILTGFLIYSLTKINNNYNTILLIINNIFFSVIDILFRIIKQYNSRETQVAPHPIPL